MFKGKSPLMASYFPLANDYGANPICVNLEDGESILCIWIWENWRIDASVVLQRVFGTLLIPCPRTA